MSIKYQWLQTDVRERIKVMAMVTQGGYERSNGIINYLLIFSDGRRNMDEKPAPGYVLLLKNDMCYFKTIN